MVVIPDKREVSKDMFRESADKGMGLTKEKIRHAERIVEKFARVKNSWEKEETFFQRLKETLYKDYKIIAAVVYLMNSKYAPGPKPGEPGEAYFNCCLLLKEMLTDIRFSVDRDHPWALEAAEQLQHYFAEKAFNINIDMRIQTDILHALYESGLELLPELKQKSREVTEYYGRFQLRSGGVDMEKVFDELTDNASENPFILHDNLMAEMNTMSVQQQVLLVGTMLKSSNRLMQEMGVLMLLHPEPEVRRNLLFMFEELDDYAQLKPDNLRRLIGIRNWVPVDERPAIDVIIQNMRRARVECAPMPIPGRVDAYGSYVDGSGSLGFWLVEKIQSQKGVAKKRYNSFSVLLRQASGIYEVWGERKLNQKKCKAMIRGITQNAQCITVNHEYINRLCAHFIQKGIEKGCPPPILMVYTAEAMGQYWIPESIDFQMVLASMADTLEPKYQHPDHVNKVLRKSGTWPKKQAFTLGWFEDNSKVDALLKKRCSHFPNLKDNIDFVEAMTVIITDVLDEKRIVWAERLLLMAVRAFSSQGGHKRMGNDFFIVAKELYGKTPLEEIPLMISVAEVSVQSAINRAHAR